jgi:hypothetical protein
LAAARSLRPVIPFNHLRDEIVTVTNFWIMTALCIKPH